MGGPGTSAATARRGPGMVWRGVMSPLLLLLLWAGMLCGTQAGPSLIYSSGVNSVDQLTAIPDSIQPELSDENLAISKQLNRMELALEYVRSQLDRISSQRWPVRDCSDLPASAPSGIYLVQPGLRQPVPAYCDQETDGGGWTVIQRRADITPRQDFNLGWSAYKHGFGQLDAEF